MGQGNVFTPVCDCVHRGVSAPLLAGIHPPGDTPVKGKHPLPSNTTGYGQQVGGTHPTGMHTCNCFVVAQLYSAKNKIKIVMWFEKGREIGFYIQAITTFQLTVQADTDTITSS